MYPSIMHYSHFQQQQSSLPPEITETSSDDDKAKQKYIPLLWKNLTHALSETKTEPVHATDSTTTTNSKPDSATAPAKKKAKKERLLGFRLIDPFKVWIHIKEFVEESANNNKDDTTLLLLPEALPTTLGVKLSEVGVAGMINGMAAVPGGMVDKHFKVLHNTGSSKGTTPEIETAAGPVTLAQLKHWSELLHQAVQSRLEKDVLDSTPQRIADMLAPDLTPAEFRGVRRRIYDTVILGKGLKVDDGYDDVPVANTSQSVHDIEKVGLVEYNEFANVPTNRRLQKGNGATAFHNRPKIITAVDTILSFSLLFWF